MLRFLLALVLAAGFATAALADSQGSATGGTAGTQSTLAGCLNGSQAPSSGQQAGLHCNSDGTLAVSISGSGASVSAVAGTQVGLTISSATSLTVPTGATLAVIQPQGTNNSSGVCLYWRDDGTAPTASTGQQMSAGATMSYKVNSLPIQLIAATGATCTATISYYK